MFSQSSQLTRDIAEIERAAAMLCKAEPALETWRGTSNDALIGAQHSAWQSIALVWFLTVLGTVGIIAAIIQLTGQAAGRLF